MKLDCPDIPLDIYLTDIVTDGGTRRSAEEAAVARLVAEAFGAGARRCHRSDGSPYILQGDGSEADAGVSISHSRGMAALAIIPAGTEAGIDIEDERPQLVRVIPRICSPAECDAYAGGDGLLRAWTMKEALYKAARHRLGKEIDFTAQIHLPAAGSDIAAVSSADGQQTLRYRVYHHRVAPGTLLTAVVSV